MEKRLVHVINNAELVALATLLSLHEGKIDPKKTRPVNSEVGQLSLEVIIPKEYIDSWDTSISFFVSQRSSQ